MSRHFVKQFAQKRDDLREGITHSLQEFIPLRFITQTLPCKTDLVKKVIEFLNQTRDMTGLSDAAEIVPTFMAKPQSKFRLPQRQTVADTGIKRDLIQKHHFP